MSGERVLPTTIEVRLVHGPNLSSVVAHLDPSVDTHKVHGVACTSDGPPRDVADLGPVTRARNGHIWVTIPERWGLMLPLDLLCTEDAPEPRAWVVPAAFEITREAQLRADAEAEQRREGPYPHKA